MKAQRHVICACSGPRELPAYHQIVPRGRDKLHTLEQVCISSWLPTRSIRIDARFPIARFGSVEPRSMNRVYASRDGRGGGGIEKKLL